MSHFENNSKYSHRTNFMDISIAAIIALSNLDVYVDPQTNFYRHFFLLLVRAMLLSARCAVIITDGIFQFIMTGKNNNESCKQEKALHFCYKLLGACQFEKQLRALARQKCTDALRLDYNSISNLGRAKLTRHKA